jgi:CubicO group peptidase (beta-lactamase class C family)
MKKFNCSLVILGLFLSLGVALYAQPVIEPDLNNPKYDFSGVDNIVTEAINDTAFPGGVVLVGHNGKIIYEKAFGNYTYDKNSTPMTVDVMFDMASVSKVVGTTTAAMYLYDQGKLNLDDKVVSFFPDFGVNGKEKATVRNLLLHNSGMPAFAPFYKKLKTAKEEWDSIRHMKPDYETGAQYVYSCLGMITLQHIIEKISGKGLDVLLKENFFAPLGMKHTMYNPPDSLIKKCAPTEVDKYWRMTTLQGKVHDETAYLLGGVSGNAGVFSTAPDLAIFCQMMLNKGFYNGRQYIKPSTVEEWTKKQTSQSSRGLGWDTNENGETAAWKKFSFTTFGHTGFTGTSIFIDKERDLFAIILTNRVYPTRDNVKIIPIRHKIHDAIISVIDKK